jgi:NADH-quinone oxidoreductase subunit H
MGGFASGNPLASLGASREMKLILAYELPFILVIFIPVIQAGMKIRLGEILSYQLNNGIALGSLSGIIGFLVAILCMQAKLTLVPFDMPEAETEIMAGTYIEYSGVPLAIYKLSRAMMLFVLLKYVLLLVIIVLIRNTAPRVRIDQAVKFFWGPMTGLAVAGIILAFLGI